MKQLVAHAKNSGIGLLMLGGAVLALIAPSAQGQEIIKTYTGIWDSWNPWAKLAFSEDLDGDGYGELIVGDGFFGTGGKITVLSGLSGVPIYAYVGAPDVEVGLAVGALGDVDGDGVPDFGGASGLGLTTWVWSGQDGSEICTLPYSCESITGLGDLNGDSLQDFLLGKPNLESYGGGTVDVFLGGSCPAPYYTVQPSSGFVSTFGRVTVGLEDVDGDGIRDFAVGAPATFSMDCLLGYVAVHSGADGSLIYDLQGETVDDFFGWALAAPGDITGDGRDDLVVSAIFYDGINDCKSIGPGKLYFYDGPTGALLDTIEVDWPYSSLGRNLASVGDANGNGVPDVLVQVFSPATNGSELRLIEGATRELIYAVPNPFPDNMFGHALAGTGDWDGDDFPDFLVGSPSDASSPAVHPGRIDLFSGAPVGVRAFGEACPDPNGNLPRIGATGSPKIGTDYELHLSRVAPGATGILVVGLSNATWWHTALPLRLGFAGFPGCALQVSVDRVYFAPAKAVGPGQGAATVSLSIANDPGLVGSSIFAQWFVPDPLGAPGRGAATRGLELTFQP